MATLDVIIKQMILSAFRSAQMTSASPGHINRFIGIESQGGMDIIGSNEEINDAIRQAVEGIASDSNITAGTEDTLIEDLISDISAEEVGNLISDISDAEGRTRKKGKGQNAALSGLGIVGGIGNDPTSVIARALPLLPHATLIVFALLLAPLIFDILTKPGGSLDLRFKRIISDEVNAFLSRQTQRDTEMGVRQVIIQSKTGFTAVNGFNNYNTVKGIREGGINKEQIDRIGKVDHTRGIFDFG